MARKIRAKLILQLYESGMSQNEIARSQGMSKHSVSDVIHRAADLDIDWSDVAAKTEHEVYSMFFSERQKDAPVYPDPDWSYIHKELAKTGVTLKLLHAEYVDRQKSRALPYMGYDRFCKRYKSYTVSQNITSRVGHKAGRVMEVDWSGPTMTLVDPATGEVVTVYLFVACLPFSRYSYVEPTLDMKQDTWLLCHIHAFEFFGGSTACIVPDNLKTGVIKHPREGEVILNESYREMAAHYSAAILPARVSRPKDKASVENEVHLVATKIIASLRHEVFSDFHLLKQAISQKLEEHNKAPFSKRSGSRYLCFYEEEKETLRPLPKTPYEICKWVYNRKVQINCHVAYEKNYYSAPHFSVGKSVDLRITENTLEIYLANERIATHPLFPSYCKNRYSTHESDLPEGKSYSGWDSDRIRRWAERVGPSCSAVIERIFQSVKFDEQGFNAALAVLRLSHKYSNERLEKACLIALNSGKRTPKYRDIEPILKTNQDKFSGPSEESLNNSEADIGYVRGAQFYEEV